MGSFIDLSGQRFGKLKVVRRDGYIGNAIAWLCECDCGNTCRIRGSSLRSGGVKQCLTCAGKRRVDLTEQRFGRLVAKYYIGMRGHSSFWHCVCDCGNEKDVSSEKLRSGNTKSCGCLHKEQLAKRGRIHGMSDTRAYKLYASMKSRCYNKNNKEWPHYGGRGIHICDEWLQSFEAFNEWLSENGYDKNAPRGVFTIDRIDNDGDYCPENCRLIDIWQQNRRRQEIEVTTEDGITRRYWSVRALSRVLHVDKTTIKHACDSGEPLPSGTHFRRCRTLKLLGHPDDYIGGVIVDG